MNYDQPRQLESGGWHYTTFNRRIGTFPIGYCPNHRDQPHATEDDARRCYRDYELNERLDLDRSTISAWVQCSYPGCETLTNREAMISGWPKWQLCDEHRTRECCTELYGEMAGDSVHS